MLAEEVGRGGERSHRKVAKPPVFNGKAGKVLGFMTACKLYIRVRMMGMMVEEQVQWVLLFVQGGLVDIWKENVLEDLEERVLEYKSVGEFWQPSRKSLEEERKSQ